MKKNFLSTLTISVLAFAGAVQAAQPTPGQADQRKAYIDKTFASMDANGDGRVDKAEYAKFQQARFDKQAQAAEAAFEAMDKDKDGKISKAEAAVVPEIEKYFDGLDTDKDGFLSRTELQNAMLAAQTTEASGR